MEPNHYKTIGEELLAVMRSQYADLAEFHKSSGAWRKVSRETVRTLLYEGRPISEIKLFYVCRYLGMPPQKTRDYLLLVGEKDLADYIGEATDTHDPWERDILEFVRTYPDKNTLAHHLDLLAKSEGINPPGDAIRRRRRNGNL